MSLRTAVQACLAGGGIVLSVMGLLFLFWAVAESRLPFNEEGRYFDSVKMVVHLQQDVLGYTLIAGGFFALASVLLVSRIWVKRLF